MYKFYSEENKIIDNLFIQFFQKSFNNKVLYEFNQTID